LRDLAGRSLNSIQARIWTILILYNAVKILEMKYEDKMEKLKDKMREKGERSYLSGCALIDFLRYVKCPYPQIKILTESFLRTYFREVVTEERKI